MPLHCPTRKFHFLLYLVTSKMHDHTQAMKLTPVLRLGHQLINSFNEQTHYQMKLQPTCFKVGNFSSSSNMTMVSLYNCLRTPELLPGIDNSTSVIPQVQVFSSSIGLNIERDVKMLKVSMNGVVVAVSLGSWWQLLFGRNGVIWEELLRM